jgi:diaminopimelate decarboxylase
MKPFNYQSNTLHVENTKISSIVKQYGSPCFIYSRSAIEQQVNEFKAALSGQDALICYAVKANSNVGILNLLANMGCGFDIVSAGELQRVLRAGGDPQKIVFSGVGKTHAEIKLAINTNIHCFNVESIPELKRINKIAQQLNKKAPISLRINPDVDAKTHPYISTGLKNNKFGIAFDDIIDTYTLAKSLDFIEIKGIDCHIGSQITDNTPFSDALNRVLQKVDQLSSLDINIDHIDVGGGLGIQYNDETPPTIESYIHSMVTPLKNRSLKLILEPGRNIIGNAGILVTKTEYLKLGTDKNFAIVDAAMNDLSRPTLYDAWHKIAEVNNNSPAQRLNFDVVGPICESGDFLGKNRELKIEEGDLLAVFSAGAYGFTMSSNYNSRPRVAEILVSGEKFHLIREREKIDDLMRGEHIAPR